jgi:Na+-translocating ferredoxin:NAD+ oxidoreductase RnfG subunit
MNNSNTLSIIVAVIAAVSSLFVAGISYVSTRKNASELESLKADLAEKQAEIKARRDYL